MPHELNPSVNTTVVRAFDQLKRWAPGPDFTTISAPTRRDTENMSQPVAFLPPNTPTSQSASSREWAVAWREGSKWQRSEAVSEEDARSAASMRLGSVVISREVLGWTDSPVHVPSTPYDGRMDALVDRIVDEENAIIRAAIERGADIAITHMATPRNRVAHQLLCPSLETQLDRRVSWSSNFRERLVADRNFRPAMPHFATREEARHIAGLRSCKICWPNIEESDAPPIRELSAEGLKKHHIGKTLSSPSGVPVGVIQEITIKRGSAPDDRFLVDGVTVRVGDHSIEMLPRDRVYVLNSLDAEGASRREATLRSNVGLS